MNKKTLNKIIVLSTVSILSLIGFLFVKNTNSLLQDIENSNENSFSAGTLDFSLSADSWNLPEKVSAMKPGDSAERNITVANNGSLGFQYKLQAIKTGGDDEFCNALQIVAKLGSEEKYSGSLLELNNISVFSDPSSWNFNLSLPNSSEDYRGQSCDFKFVYVGAQENLNFGEGFYDIEEVTNNVLAADIEISRYSSIADSYIDQYSPNSEYGDKQYLNVKSEQNTYCSHYHSGVCQTWKTDIKNQRAFVGFNFLLPRGTQILSSSLNLYMNSAPNISRNYEVQHVNSSWKEDEIKWDHKPNTSGTISSVSTGVTSNTWLNWDVTQDVQSFVNGTENNGWQIKDSAENSDSPIQAQFRSREFSDVNYRPYLDISFKYPEITTNHLVINEIYYDVNHPSRGDSDNEWVEIYNPTDSPINISGWKICDNDGCDVIPTTSPIPAKGFAVASGLSSTFSYWTLPTGTITIDLSGDHIGGNGLANSGDRVILKNSSDIVIDAVSYGNDHSQLNPAVSGSGEGKSIARILKGFDNDSAEDWIINASPNPGTNPSVNGIEFMRFTDEGIIMSGTEEGLDNQLNNFEEVDTENFADEVEPESEIIDSEISEAVSQNSEVCLLGNIILEDNLNSGNSLDNLVGDEVLSTNSESEEETEVISEEIPPATNEIETVVENINNEETDSTDISTPENLVIENSEGGEVAPLVVSETSEIIPPVSE